MWLSIELLAHARFYVHIRTTRGSLPHVVIIISAYCITISLSSACAYKPGFTVYGPSDTFHCDIFYLCSSANKLPLEGVAESVSSVVSLDDVAIGMEPL